MKSQRMHEHYRGSGCLLGRVGPDVSVEWHGAVDLIERLLGYTHPPAADPGLVADLNALTRASERGWYGYRPHTGCPASRENR